MAHPPYGKTYVVLPHSMQDRLPGIRHGFSHYSRLAKFIPTSFVLEELLKDIALRTVWDII